MFRINKSIPIPPVLLSDGVSATRQNEQAFLLDRSSYISGANIRSKDIKKFDINAKIYGAPEVKQQLKNDQFQKCCFCEAKFTANGHGDVEHFRPKSAYKKKNSKKLTYPGYYWLAYNWDNLLFSCQICNESFKKNEFPLLDERKRVKTHIQSSRLSRENPILIDPLKEDPSQYIGFEKEVPVPMDGLSYTNQKRALESIRIYGLNRQSLCDARLEYLQKIDALLPFANVDLNSPAEIQLAATLFKIGEDEIKAKITSAKRIIESSVRITSEYSSMMRSNFPAIPIT